MYDDGDSQRFVMLNGAQGSFCLDVREKHPDENVRSLAWSSNVGHYISAFSDYIEVQRWDRPANSFERYSVASVATNMERFHQHLEKSSPRSDASIIAHGLRIFRSLRNGLGPSFSG